MDLKRTTADRVNLRSGPALDPDNILGTLPLGHAVEIVSGRKVQGFVEVLTSLNGLSTGGFVYASLLREALPPRREAIIQEAVGQWIRFERGKGLETEEPYFRHVGEFWRALGKDLDGRDTESAWSAAFVSFAMRRAGLDRFKFAAAHSRYILDAKRAREEQDTSAPFWLFRLEEHQPQLGDLVCAWRTHPRTFDDLPPSGFKSHCDIVVEIRRGQVRTIGGNVRDSVADKRFVRDRHGFVAQQATLFAIMRNNEGRPGHLEV